MAFLFFSFFFASAPASEAAQGCQRGKRSRAGKKSLASLLARYGICHKGNQHISTGERTRHCLQPSQEELMSDLGENQNANE